MNTFTFGYLEKKWKRLLRTIWIMYFITVCAPIIHDAIVGWINTNYLLMLTFLIPVPISYVLEPFATSRASNENSSRSS